MTVVVPEVAEAMADARTARRARHVASRARPRPAAQRAGGGGGRGRIPLPSEVRGPQPSRSRQAGSAYARQARYVGQNAQITPGDRNWQGLILAEFVVAELLVVVAPLARPSTGGTSPSPYDPNDLKQLVAIGAVYFILALASSGSHGKISAGIGGLVLLVLLLRGFQAGSLQSVLALFTPYASGVGAGGTDTGPGSAGSGTATPV